MIPYSVYKKIVDEINIVDVVGEYITLNKKGSNYFGVCPFHADHKPSMSVTNKVKMFQCWSCGAKGNVINFVSRFENIPEEQAVLKLAKRINLVIDEKTSKEDALRERLEKVMSDTGEFFRFYLHNSTEGPKALDYLHSRDLGDDIIQTFDIGLSPDSPDALYKYLIKKGHQELDLLELGLVNEASGKYHDVFRNRIMFPLKNQYGKIVGFSGRIYNNSDQAKYINSNDNKLFHKGEILYNLDKASNFARKQNQIYVFEGFMDVIAAYKSGIYNCVAAMGTALTTKNAKNLSALTNNIILCFDGDSAGIKAMNNSTVVLAKENIIPSSVVLPDNMDPDEYIQKYGKDKLKEYLTANARNVYIWLYHLAKLKLVKGDLVSTEKFKQEVFNFINLSGQETIINYYLQKASEDLEIDTKSLQNDFNTFKDKNITRQTNFSDEVINKPVTIKKVSATPGIKKAFKFIILYTLDSFGAATKYFETVSEFYPGDDLKLEYSILLELRSFEQTYFDNVPTNLEEAIRNYLKKDPSFIDYIDKSIAGMLLDKVTEDDYLQCSEKIIKYFNRMKTTIQKNRYLGGDKAALDSFMNQKKKETQNG